MSAGTKPVFPDAFVGPNSFAAWLAQGAADSDQIRAVYASLAAADEDSIG